METLLNLEMLNKLIDERVNQRIEEIKQEEQPLNIKMPELIKITGWSRDFIVKNIINRNYFRRKIEPFSKFPKNDRGEYRFHRKKMMAFIDEYYEEIEERAKEGRKRWH